MVVRQSDRPGHLTPPKCYVSQELLDLAKKTSSATVSGVLTGIGFRFIYMAGVHPVRPGSLVVGRAYTLRYLPRREDLTANGPDRQSYPQTLAIESLGQGDVMVVDARGNTEAGIFGDLLVARMQYRGAAGLVTDGALRDTPFLRTNTFPCFVKGAHGYGHPSQHWAADVQLPIACGGVLVYPGDLIVGDDDGVAVCPQALAEEVVKRAVEQETHELYARDLITEGVPINEAHPPFSQEREAAYQAWRHARGL
ncbi:MAG: ribonuclease activity regulator RraA [Chloroflexi bacterium]|nr:ribonuclease activity regulator RraA [Chloroflexota bacterium]